MGDLQPNLPSTDSLFLLVLGGFDSVSTTSCSSILLYMVTWPLEASLLSPILLSRSCYCSILNISLKRGLDVKHILFIIFLTLYLN